MSRRRPEISVGGLRFPAPEHLSHSSRELLLRCAKSWFLKYLTAAPRSVSLWTAIGSAVHEATEAYDRSDKPESWTPEVVRAVWNSKFGGQLEGLRRKESDQHKWRFSPTEPVEVWSTLGPQLVQSWIDWRQRSPYTVWITPDGVPAIELDVSGMLPGCPVEIKGYIDVVMEDPVFDQLIIIDKKTSKKPPATADQLGIYAALLQVKYGKRARLGAIFMHRKGTLTRPFELAEHTPEAIGALFGEAWAQIRSGKFEADTSDCFLCDVSASCYARRGPLAAQFDPASPDYPPPY